jgi:uncharacterized protein YggE
MRTQLVLGPVAFLLSTVFVAPARGQYPAPPGTERLDGITVSGTGEVRAKPNLVEIDLQNTGMAELSADAIVKYRDNKRRMLQAFEALKLRNFAVEEKGVSLTGGMNAAELEQSLRHGGVATTPATKAQLQIARTLRLSLRGVQDMPEDELMDTLGKIFDVAKDSGIALAPSPEAQQVAQRWGRALSGASPVFVLDEITEQREQAYRKAIEDARQRAGRLAALTGVKVGPVLAVSEVQVSGDESMPAQNPYYYYYYQQAGLSSDAPGPRVTSPTFVEIPVRVKLQVRFGIAGGEKEAAEK